MRYGPSERIKDADVLKISSQEKAKEADWYPTSINKKTKKRRMLWERQAFARDTDVVIGTLEMACDLQTEELPLTSKLILVDEAAQATEPMTLIPFTTLTRMLSSLEIIRSLLQQRCRKRPTSMAWGPICLNV
jgi:hypothetical protein